MLSTQPLANSKSAQHYFLGQDNYYSDQAQAQTQSVWWGKGAQDLGLSGQVESELFVKLLEGQLPNGEQLGVMQQGEIKHRPGFDLTLSVPKSVSILALLGGDERIIASIQKAADHTLTIIERDCAQARKTQQGVTTYEQTQNLVVAKFLHDISREGDPQLHVHCVVLNMTQRQDGQWRSLASQIGRYDQKALTSAQGFFEKVRHQQHYFGMLFRAELAYELKQLGYEIVKTNAKYGLFEVAGISEKTLAAYSQRRQQIEQYMQQYGFSSAKAAAIATLNTRQPKKNINRETLQELWQAQAAHHQIDAFGEAKKVVDTALKQEKLAEKIDQAHLSKAQTQLHFAIAHLSETQTILKEKQIIQLALAQTIAEKIPVQAFFQVIEKFQQEGALILLKKEETEHYFTTKALVEAEKAILAAIPQQSINALPIVEKKRLQSYLVSHAQLKPEQITALRTLFSSTFAINVVTGTSGSGKTFLLKPMLELAQSNGYQTFVLTPGALQAKTLAQDLVSWPKSLRQWLNSFLTSQQTMTVSRFIQAQEKLLADNLFGSGQRALILVEQANLLSTQHLQDLLKATLKSEHRLILLGDKQALLSWQAGTPFTQLLDKGAFCVELKHNQHAQNQTLKTAVADTLTGNITAAFTKIDSRILAIADAETRASAMARHYGQLSVAEREKSFVLLPNQALCERLNSLIRSVLKENEQIAKTGSRVTILAPQHLSQAQRQYAHFYKVGDILRFNQNQPSLNVQRGDYVKILSVDAKANQLHFKNQADEQVIWDLTKITDIAKTTEVFKLQSREIVVGDRLLWRRTHAGLQLHAGEVVQVEKIEARNFLVVKNARHEKIKIDLTDSALRHFDYAYATTPLQKQALRADTILAYQSSFAKSSHQRLFYKTLSQANQQVWIYTENKGALLTHLQKTSGDKLSAIDALVAAKLDRDPSSAQGHPHPYIQLLEAALTQSLAKEADTLTLKKPEQMAKAAIDYALAHLAEREAAFTHEEVLTVALKYSLGNTRIKQMEEMIELAEKNGQLMRGAYSTDGKNWTTKAAIRMEQEILSLAKQDAATLTPLVVKTKIEAYLEKVSPKAEHAQAIQAICASQDRHLLIQGMAGTGKTTLLKHLAPLLKQEGYTLLCLAPTHVAVKELTERGLTAQTLDSFIAKFRQGSPNNTHADFSKKTIIALDENSMSSNRRFLDLLRIVQALEFRGIYIGDKKQHKAITAGKPHTLLENYIKTIYLSDIERQKNPRLLKAVKESYQMDFTDAFTTLEDSIVEMGQIKTAAGMRDDKDVRLQALCDDYLAQSPKARSQTLVITLSNADRTNLNELIRTGLIAKGELTGNPTEVAILVSHDLTEIEKTHVANYQVGELLRFGFANSKLGLNKGEYATIQEAHLEKNLFILKKADGTTSLFRPKLNPKTENVGFEVYNTQTREIRVGDFIRWTRTDKNLGLLSPQMAQVAAINGLQLCVHPAFITKEGLQIEQKPMFLKTQQHAYQHWDYAYVMTGYSSQGKTIAKTLIHLESYSKNLTTQSSWIVALTRAQHAVKIYTDNKQSLLQQIIENPGEKKSSLETIGQWQAGSPHVDKNIDNNTAANNITMMAAIEKKSEIYFDEYLPIKSEMYEDILHRDTPLKAQVAISGTTEKRTHKKDKSNVLNSQQISQLLQDNADIVVERLLGAPKEKTGGQYRYSSKQGSLVVTLHGEKRGLWHDFQTGEGGHLLQLIAKQAQLDIKSNFKQVLNAACQLLGADAQLFTAEKRVKGNSAAAKIRTSTSLSETQKRSLQYARKLYAESRSIKNTAAERYLHEQRGITLEQWPASVRFHPGIYSKINQGKYPALLVIAKDESQKIQAVQAIFLDEKTANKALVKVQKQTWGMPSKGFVDLSLTKNPSELTLLAEGPETGLSILQAFSEHSVKITLGKSNFKNNSALIKTPNVVLCLDQDGKVLKDDKVIEQAARKLSQAGKTVWLAQPEGLKKDYNDVLKEQGMDAVKANIAQAISYQDFNAKIKEPVTLKNAVLDKQAQVEAQVAASLNDKRLFNAVAISPINFSKLNLKALPLEKLALNKGAVQIDMQQLSQAAALLQPTQMQIKDLAKLRDSSLNELPLSKINSTFFAKNLNEPVLQKNIEQEKEI